MKQVSLIYVDVKDATQSNKYYNMFEVGSQLKVEYGRVGSTKTEMFYPISKWNSIYNSKINKGYKDITDLKKVETIVSNNSGNSDFDEFYDTFKKYTTDSVRNTYLVEGCTKQQLNAAQDLLNTISKLTDIEHIKGNLLDLYKIIPRRMSNVRDFLPKSLSDLDYILVREQNALNSMDSNNIISTVNPFKELNISFEVVKEDALKNWILSTSNRKIDVHKIYKITNYKQKIFDDWLSKQNNKKTELLLHGTRNPNIFSILKSDLMIRPTNAAVISGAAYGEGIYHSAHTDKSLNYVGSDADKIFFIQNVHMGNNYIYNGWYREGKDISRNQMNYTYLKSKGYDSLYVKPGDGLLNSEYIVYNSEQTVTNFLIWLK